MNCGKLSNLSYCLYRYITVSKLRDSLTMNFKLFILVCMKKSIDIANILQHLVLLYLFHRSGVFFPRIHRSKLITVLSLNLLFHWNEHNSQRLTQPQSTKDSPLRTSGGGGSTEGGGFWSWATWGGISYTGRRGASLTMPTSFTSWSSVFDRFDNHSDSVFSGSLSSNALVLSSRTFCFSLTILSRSAFLSSVKCENLQLSIKLHIPVLIKFLHGRFDSSSWRTISGFLKFRINFEWLIKKYIN